MNEDERMELSDDEESYPGDYAGPDDALEDEDFDVVACGQCGHPNLAFRNHCRRCGLRLQDSANLVPGADLIEWTSTDGRSRREKSTPLQELLVLVVLLALLPFAAVLEWLIAVLLAGVVAVIAWHLWSRGRDAPAESEDTQDIDEDPLFESCPECGSPVQAVDDICAECGAIVADDFRHAD
jgi:uncharacterized OB-fold protein